MIILTGKRFEKAASKLSSGVKQALAERLRIFSGDPFNRILNNHPLHGNMRTYRSINITGDYRLVYEDRGDGVAAFIDIDTHSNLYGK